MVRLCNRSKPVVERRTVEIPEDQMQARVKFGLAVKNWFRHEGFSQDVPHKFAQDLGLNGPWNSQISLLMAGKLDPKAQFWLSLEHFNHTIALQNFTLISDSSISRRLEGKNPMILADGEVADATDFFAMFIGKAQWHEKYDSAPLLSDEEAERVGLATLKVIENIQLNEMLTRKELWASVEADLPDYADLIAIKRFFVGIDPYTPELHRNEGQHLMESLARYK